MKKGGHFMRKMLGFTLIAGIVFGVLSGAMAAPYFQGKVITFIVPTSAGGGTDTWGRMLARNIYKFIPGQPTIVVRNMPGAEHLIGGNYVWTSKPNGLTWLVASASTVTTNILRPKGTEFNLGEMHPIYSSPIGQVFYIKTGMIKEPKDIMNIKGLIFGCDAPTDTNSTTFIWTKELLGFPTEKMIFAYSGTGPSLLAFVAGEINASAGSTLFYNTGVKQHVDRGTAMPLFQSGLMDMKGNVVRESAAPSVPTVRELYQQIYGKEPSGLSWEAYKLAVGLRTFGKALLLPKQTPLEIVNIAKKAAIEMVKDPKFLAEAERDSPGAPHFTGDELARVYPAGVGGPPAVIQHIKKIYAEKYGVRFE